MKKNESNSKCEMRAYVVSWNRNYNFSPYDIFCNPPNSPTVYDGFNLEVKYKCPYCSALWTVEFNYYHNSFKTVCMYKTPLIVSIEKYV